MLEVTREKAINMLVDYDLDSLNSDELREAYADMAKNGTKGYNGLTDGNLADVVENVFNETDGVRIVPSKEERVRDAVERHWNEVMPSFKNAIEYDSMQQFFDEWVDDVMYVDDEYFTNETLSNFNSVDISLGFQRTVLNFVKRYE